MSGAPPAAAAPPLIQYWDAERPPDDVAELLESVGRRNPDMEHFVFSEASADALIAARFTPREVAAFRACGVPAMQADYFRYCAVLVLGGAYVDADFRGIAPLRPLLVGAEGRLFGRPGVPRDWPQDLFGDRERVGPYRIIANSLFLFRTAGHPLLRLVVEIATANVEQRIAEDVAVTTGPGIFTSLYLLKRLGSFDAFLDYAARGILATSADLFCEVVGSVDRVVEAFAGVSISPFKESKSTLLSMGNALAYKSSDAHWVNKRGTIFKP